MATQVGTVDIEIIASEGAEAPIYSSAGAAGADLRAYLTEPMTIAPGKSALVPTGLRMAIPEGYELQIRPRSGLAFKDQITVLNAPGTIDSDYRGEIGIILINHGTKDFIITPGMRIAQCVVAPFYQATFLQTAQLTATQRGDGGFGHTGL